MSSPDLTPLASTKNGPHLTTEQKVSPNGIANMAWFLTHQSQGRWTFELSSQRLCLVSAQSSPYISSMVLPLASSRPIVTGCRPSEGASTVTVLQSV